MSEALRRIAEAVADATEDEVAAALDALGALRERPGQALYAPRTPLPPPGDAPGILSEVEWV
ncbi:hypothetical protein QFZ66_005658 [Streptomyces sp. B4I13]|nr:hypothetical protein [Streptomyces sp. B4I13]